MLALTDARKKANEKYIQNNYKQVKLSMPNAEAETLDQYCKVSAKYSCGFSNSQISPIIVAYRYLDYFTTIM